MTMEMKQIANQDTLKQYQFKMTDEDTCMRTWTFDIEETDGEQVVKDSFVEYTKQGCNGHPKTISALIKGRKVSEIDLNALKETTCFRSQSCGMSLAACLEALSTN